MAKKTSEEKHQFWANHVQAWQLSGLSQSSYCKRHSISYDQFNYQYNRFHKTKAVNESPDQKKASDFITLNIAPTTTQSAMMTQFRVSHTTGATFEWSAPWGPKEVALFIGHWGGSA